MQARPTVSIIIPNWNGLIHLKGCLDSISAQTYKPLETIIVDNGSTDGSFEYVRRYYSQVHILGLSRNHGFAYAVNRGIEAARGDFVALLNNDTELDVRWLEEMASALNNDSTLGSVACKMLNFDRRAIIDSVGDGISPFGSPYSRAIGKHDEGTYDKEELVFGVCAGAALYRKIVFDVVGYMDEDFVTYYEDVDFSFRMQLAGFKCLYIPRAICYHKRGATGGNETAFTVRMAERNLTAYYIKNFPLAILVERLPLIMASRLKRLFLAVLGGRGGAAFIGLFQGLTLVPRMLVKRRRVQSLRKVSIQYVKSLMKRNS